MRLPPSSTSNRASIPPRVLEMSGRHLRGPDSHHLFPPKRGDSESDDRDLCRPSSPGPRPHPRGPLRQHSVFSRSTGDAPETLPASDNDNSDEEQGKTKNARNAHQGIAPTSPERSLTSNVSGCTFKAEATGSCLHYITHIRHVPKGQNLEERAAIKEARRGNRFAQKSCFRRRDDTLYEGGDGAVELAQLGGVEVEVAEGGDVALLALA